jgi:hypothetical protein
MYVEVDTNPTFAKPKKIKKKEYALTSMETDFTAQLTLTDLEVSRSDAQVAPRSVR